MNTRYIPKGYTKIGDKKSDAIAYISEGISKNTLKKSFYAVVYFGKATKAVGNYRFNTAAQRDAYVMRCFSDRQASQRQREVRAGERKIATAKMATEIKVGDVLRSSWGYDQTNINYYEILEIKGVTVTLVELEQCSIETGFMSGKTSPMPGAYSGKPFKRRVGAGYVRINSCQLAYVEAPQIVAGVPVYRSSYWSSYA